jgi:microtubule-associated protein-like 6
VYHAAALGIVHNIKENTQTLFNKHADDCISISIHPKGKIIATGELGPKPSIFVWEASTGNMLFQLKKGLAKGIDNLQYSQSGKYLVGTMMDDDHTMVVYDVEQDYETVHQMKTGKEEILGICWTSDAEFVLVGNKRFSQVSIGGSAPSIRKGAAGKEVLLVAACLDNDILTGNMNGELQVWKGTSPSKSLPLHKGPLESIRVSPIE